MADRWNEDQARSGRAQERGFGRDGEPGANGFDSREGRSFNPGGPRRDRVFGEVESGASYTGPAYGAGGYTGYGERSVNERGYGSRNYSTGRDGGGYRSAGYGADLYQERNAEGYRGDRGPGDARGGARGYDREQDDHWTFGFGNELEGPAYARGHSRREYEATRGGREAGNLWERTQRFFGGDGQEDRDQESHRGRGPQGYRRPDERINDEVHDRLTEDRHIDASGVTVTVQDGEVTLSGTVTSRHAKHHAEHIIEDLSGVKHVQNNLRVQEPSASRGASTTQSMPLGENSKLSDQAAGKA
jgi:osmotically-inducible protein OsmY